MNPVKIEHAPQDPAPVALPGIEPATVKNAGIRRVDPATAEKVTGLFAPGILIPYFDFDGTPIGDNGEHYYRLRLDEPRGDQKYHQRAGSSPHAYIPERLHNDAEMREFFLIEGEKKALALCDHGLKAIGISGFYGYSQGEVDRKTLVPELWHVNVSMQPETIYFTGDQDTVFNCQFYDAAIKLQGLFPTCQIFCCQVPMSAPSKGFDDCRAAMSRDDFSKLIEEAKKNATKLKITKDATVGSLALTAFRGQQPTFTKMASQEEAKDRLIKDATKLAAGLEMFRGHYESERVAEIAVQFLGLKKRTFNRLVKDKRTSEKERNDSFLSGNGNTTLIEIGEQQGVWAREAAEKLGGMLYWHGKKFAEVHDGALVHLLPAELVTYLDRPGVCQFFTVMSDGTKKPTRLSSQEASYIVGVPVHSADLVRPIEVLASVPTLVWNGEEFKIITGYDRESCIYAQGELPPLPTLEEARDLLLDLLCDFDFATPYDMARCLAFMLTPAIVRSGVLNGGRCPFFMVTKNLHGAGGGFMMRLVAQIYGMKAAAVVPGERNHDRVKEGVSAHLSKGNALIYIDNVRGDALQHMAFLESMLTEPEFEARAPYMQALVDVTREVFACTSNGAVMSRDLADRTAEIKILRKPKDYEFRDWPEGTLEAHVRENRPAILAAIYRIILGYGERGIHKKMRLTGFRFSQWEHCATWIIKDAFPTLPGLLEDDYSERKESELTDPVFDLIVNILRSTALKFPKQPISTSRMAELAKEEGHPLENDKPEMFLGRHLSRLFPSVGTHVFAGKFKVTRTDHVTASSNGNLSKFYEVEMLAPTAKSCMTPNPAPDPSHTSNSSTLNNQSMALGPAIGQFDEHLSEAEDAKLMARITSSVNFEKTQLQVTPMKA